MPFQIPPPGGKSLKGALIQRDSLKKAGIREGVMRASRHAQVTNMLVILKKVVFIGYVTNNFMKLPQHTDFKTSDIKVHLRQSVCVSVCAPL